MGELKWLKNVDWGFIGILALLLVISLVILQSASANVIAGKPEYYLKKQIIWIIIGLGSHRHCRSGGNHRVGPQNSPAVPG